MTDVNEANEQADKLYAEYRLRLNENANDLEAAVGIGNMYYDAKEPAQAVLYYRIALDIEPNQPGVMTDMATMYWHNDNTAQAEQAYRTVIASYPGFGNAYLNLGYLLTHAKKQHQEAREIWEALIEGWPNDPAANKIRELIAETVH